MKLVFEYDCENKIVQFCGDGFVVRQSASTYKEIADFAKDVIQNSILIPGVEYKEYHS